MTDRGRDQMNLQFISSILSDGRSADDPSALPANSNSDSTVANKLKIMIYKNLTAITVAFSIYYIGMFPINSVQNSLNIDWTLRMASLSVHTVSMVLQCLFFNSMFLEVLGTKRSILVGFALEVVYIGTNMHPRWWTLIPASFLSGLGRPLMHTSGCIFIVNLATFYSTNYKKINNSERIHWTFFSIFYTLCLSARVIGDIASSSIMGIGLKKFDPSQMRFDVNLTSTFSHCGPNFCDKRANPTLMVGMYDKRLIHVQTVNELCGFSLGCLLSASLIMLLCVQSLETLLHLDQSKMNGTPPITDAVARLTGWQLLDTILSWKNPKQALLLPMLLYNGMDHTFFINDFTKSYVVCLFENEIICSTLAWFGLAAPIAVGVFSIFKRPYFQSIPFLAAFGGHLGVFIAILNLNSTNYNDTALFSLTIIWGAGSGLWPYCLSVFNAIVLEKHLQTAFSNQFLFETLGALLIYILGHYLCTEMKIYVLTVTLGVGYTGYVLAEILYFRQRKMKVHP